MENNIKNAQNQIDQIMDLFDFQKVKVAMDALNWHWANIGIPELYDIKKVARKLLKETAASGVPIATAGFATMVDGEFLGLRFEIDNMWGDPDED